MKNVERPNRNRNLIGSFDVNFHFLQLNIDKKLDRASTESIDIMDGLVVTIITHLPRRIDLTVIGVLLKLTARTAALDYKSMFTTFACSSTIAINFEVLG